MVLLRGAVAPLRRPIYQPLYQGEGELVMEEGLRPFGLPFFRQPVWLSLASNLQVSFCFLP